MRLMWMLVSFRLVIVLILMQDRCTVYAKCTVGSEKSFWTHPMVLLDDEAKAEARFYPFRDSANFDTR
jgi:hypothetical protein